MSTPSSTAQTKKGRNTNQLQYLLKTIMRQVWRHSYAWPFHTPVDTVKLNLPVSVKFYEVFHFEITHEIVMVFSNGLKPSVFSYLGFIC